MSGILEKFSVFSEISEQFKQNIKLFNVFHDWNGKNVLFVTEEDEIFSFGSNHWGQCGFGHKSRVATPQKIPELSGKQIKQFFIGLDFVLALSEKSQVFGWGRNHDGQLGRGYTKWEYKKPQIIPDLENIIEISCGSLHSLALDRQGNVFGWGYNGIGQIGRGKVSGLNISLPVQLNELPKIKSVHCYNDRSFAVTYNGMVYSWGSNRENCLGHKSSNNISNPELICGLNNVISVGSSDYNTYFLTNGGKIYFCGKIDSRKYQFSPRILKIDMKFQSLQTIRNFSNYSYNSKVIALSKETVYYLESDIINQTKYKTFTDYCLIEKQDFSDKLKLKSLASQKKPFELISGGFGTVVKFDFKSGGNSKSMEYNHDRIYDYPEIKREDKHSMKRYINYLVQYIDSLTDEFSDLMDQISLIEEQLSFSENKKLKARKQTIMTVLENLNILSRKMKKFEYKNQYIPLIIHRNIQPAKIFVSYELGNQIFLKLKEFGLTSDFIYNTRFAVNPDYTNSEVSDLMANRSIKRSRLKSDLYSSVSIFKKWNNLLENMPNQLKSIEQKEVFQNLKIIKELISGDCGRVFQVKDEKSQQKYALKKIKLNQNLRKRCLEYHERIKLLPETSADYLVNYFKCWIENDFFYIQMELCFCNLEKIIEQKKNCFNRNPEESITFTEYLLSRQLFQELVECVQYLHESVPPIVHKKLHPSNILFKEEPNKRRFLKLSDFGLDIFDNKTLSPLLIKNAKYMAPEVIDGPEGEPKYTTKSDIYSLGQIFCDLFDFDLNSCGENVRNRKDLSHNWEILKQMVRKMLSPIYCDRPDCSELLSFCNNWTIDEITGVFEKTEKQNINRLKNFNLLFNYFNIKKIQFNDSIEKSLQTNPEGFGTVFKAWDKTDYKLYAMKIIGIADEAKNSIKDYQNQMNLMSELNEEYVVKYYNCFTIEQRLYIKMELCSDDLKNILEEKKLCFERQSDEGMTETEYFISSHLAKEILECVQYLHELKPPIIHRDLKPANILVNYNPVEDRFIKLCDISLVAVPGVYCISRTGYTGIMNIAPEIKSEKISTKSDIFCLGKIFNELFELDIKRVSKPSEYKNCNNLLKLIGRMSDLNPAKRPDSTELLNSYDEWAMTENILILDKSKTNSESINRMTKFKNNFFFNYFNQKFMF